MRAEPIWARQIVVVSVGRANADLAVLRGANVRHSRAPIGIAGRRAGLARESAAVTVRCSGSRTRLFGPPARVPVAMAESAGCVPGTNRTLSPGLRGSTAPPARGQPGRIQGFE